MRQGQDHQRHFWVFLLASLFVGAFAITNESLWIDEANSALKAMQPSLGAWWHTLSSEKGSDLQMPFYMFYLWCWEKIAGHSELALRAANLPWFLLGQFSLYLTCQRLRLSALPLLLLTCLNPLLWFYLNEARPYVMQYAASCMVICGLSDKRQNMSYLVAGTLLLSGSSMLGAAWSGSAILALCLIYVEERQAPAGRERWWLVTMFLGLAALGAYYLWSLTQGARGSPAGQMSPDNLAFVFYELGGFAGLGPSRLQLRETGIASLAPFSLPLLALFIALGVIVVKALPALLAPTQRSRVRTGAIYGLVAAALVAVFGFVVNFRLLGRHFTPLSPLLCLVLAVGVARSWKTYWRTASVALLLLWLASALALRLRAAQQKDDYRTAAAVARQSLDSGEAIWWVADRAAAKYYQLPTDERRPSFDVLASPGDKDLQSLLPPDMIILSKADLYDAGGSIRSYLRRENFHLLRTLPAFTVWRR